MISKPWVLVTGGSRGIGRAIVEKLCDSYFCVFTYNQSEKLATDLVNTLGRDRVMSAQCDGSDFTQNQELFEYLTTNIDYPPYAIINNLGITDDELLLSMPADKWRNVIETNIHSTFYSTQPWLNKMVESRDGVIINMSSISAIKANAGQSHYAASKAALIGLTKTLALELGRFNVRVNTIIPGLIDTEMLQTMPEKSIKSLKRNIPLKRLGETEEIAHLTDYLLSPKASYITGQSIVIDGGLSI